MNRTQLLGAASAAALACLSTAGYAANPQSPAFVQGAGSTLAYYDYLSEFSTFNAGTTGYSFGTYLPGVGSGTGQKAFLINDFTCDADKSTGANSGACVGPVGGANNTVDYGASDATFSPAQISSWATSSTGQSAAGNLIQLPSLGVGIAMVINNTKATKNGSIHLSKHDVCAIFSGLYTNYNQITDSGIAPAAGQINVTYRSDGSGTTFLLTNYLSSCVAGTDTPAGFTFTATTTFATLFGGTHMALPSNFNATGQNGGQAVADYMQCSGTPGSAAPAGAFTYLSPDFTSLTATTSQAKVCGVTSTLKLAAVLQGTTATLPSGTQVLTGLKHATGTNTVPPANATDAANPNKWVPIITGTTAGYPIVGYTTFDFAQCYADPAVTASVLNFLGAHYTNTAYKTIATKNGFVTLVNSKGALYETAIKNYILTNAKGANTNIGNTTACAGKLGR